MSAVRVLLVDDQPLFREALGVLLGARDGIEVVGEAGDGADALRQVRALAPDVVLMDLRMPVLDGIAATRRLREEHPAVRVLALTTFDGDEEVFAALRAGAVGYLLKDTSGDRLTEGTVKNHVTSVLTKLDVRDRTQAALRAHALGLLDGA